MSCHEVEIANCSESFHMEQAGVTAEIRRLLLLAALDHNAACKTQEGARYQPLSQQRKLGPCVESNDLDQ